VSAREGHSATDLDLKISGQLRREKIGPLGEMYLRSFGFIGPEDSLEDVAQITRIDLARMERTFFPKDVQHTRWQKPSLPCPFPLDDCVELLAKRSRPPKLRSEAELAAIRSGSSCPYILARTYAFMAATRAEVDSIATPRRWKAGARALEINEKVQQHLAKAVRDLEPLGWYGVTLANALEQGVVAVQRQVAIIDSELEDLPDRRGSPDLWKIAFATVLGFGWYLLTARTPSAGAGEASFVHFVESAFNSIDPENCESWESSIKTAIALVAKRPPTDRWNRWEFMRSDVVSTSSQ
jgi:hypothetical protein